jgi:feruloyl esterase
MPRTQLRARDFDPTFDRLTEVTGFGSNPGALRMFEYVPTDPEPALVVVLHGCTQTAASYDFGAGWSTLADRHGFVLLLPEQQRANNANNCFNWFCAGDIERGRGEAMSIRQMVEKMIVDHGIDRRRVFVTGLSAGGAMTSVMLATYPDVFAAGAIIAGLPYGTATNIKEAFESMGQVRDRSAQEWGDLVRAASPHKGPWPRVSVWHGGANAVVKSKNAGEIIKQWTDVHGLEFAPISTDRVDGYPRQVWRNPAGQSIIESYTIPAMAHGTPLATGPSDEHVGVPGAFLLDVGISSSYHIAKFWGLTGHPRAVPVRRSESASIVPAPPGPCDRGNVGRAYKRRARASEPTHPPHRRAGCHYPSAKSRRANEVVNDEYLSRNASKSGLKAAIGDRRNFAHPADTLLYHVLLVTKPYPTVTANPAPTFVDL